MDTASDSKAEQILRERMTERIAAVATQARCHSVWVMGLATGENAAILKSANHTVEGEPQIHSYMITRVKGKSARKTVSTGTGATRSKVSPLTLEHEFTFRIRAIRYFKHGGESGTHSENEFKEEITKVSTDLLSRFGLNLDQTVEGGDSAQIDEGFNTYGKQMCHQSDITITVCLTQTITQGN